MAKKVCNIVWLLIAFITAGEKLNAQYGDSAKLYQQINSQEMQIRRLQMELNAETGKLRNEVNRLAPISVLLVLFGAFCALWAQNTGRNSAYWFFMGVIFSAITVLVLLLYNSRDRAAAKEKKV